MALFQGTGLEQLTRGTILWSEMNGKTQKISIRPAIGETERILLNLSIKKRG